MTKLVAGMDVSGNTEEGNYKFFGLVVGTEASITSLVRQLGGHDISASNIKKNRKTTGSRLRFDGKENTAFCIKISRKTVIENASKKALKKNPRMHQAKFYQMFHRLLLHHMREEIETFVTRHHHALADIAFQCDSDCQSFAKHNGLGFSGVGNAYILADLVAWLNNNKKEPAGVISMDLAGTIEAEMKKAFK